MTYILIALGLAVLLVALGEVLGSGLPWLKKVSFPGAVLGGLLGLVAGPEGFELAAYADIQEPGRQVFERMSSFPALFINVVFACLMLGKPIEHLADVWKRARPHVVLGHIIAWGQYVVGIGITLFILSPLLSVDSLVAPSIAIGFQGGHGTAAGLTANYEAFNFADGKTIAYSIATVGVIFATVLCPLLASALSKRTGGNSTAQQDYKEPPMARETRSFSSSTGTLTMHFALITVTILIARLSLGLLTLLESKLRPDSDQLFTQFIPLFSVVLISGLFVQLLMQRLHWSPFFRRSIFNQISALGLDLVIVSALASLSLQVVKEYWITISVLAAGGFAWNLAIFFLLGTRLFSKPWLPYAVGDLGGGTGTTASGLLLIRVADPERRTNALQTYSEKQPFYEPIMGGGLVTAMALPMVAKLGLLYTLLITSGILLVWFAYAGFLIYSKKEK